MSIKCNVCEAYQPAYSSFYANDRTCKECRKRKVRENRASKAEYYREYDRLRYKNDPKVRERHIRYQATEAGKESLRRSREKFLAENPIKRAAHVIVGNYIRDGKLAKLDYCEGCGVRGGILHGHHDDYARPLDVRWLCPKCHTDWHKANGEGLNG